MQHFMNYCKSCDDIVKISFAGKCENCGKQTNKATRIDSDSYKEMSYIGKKKYRKEAIYQEYKEEISNITKGLLITTTDSIDNETITKYLNVVSSAEYFNLSGLVDEEMANTDMYYSNAYKKVLENICVKAKSIGADAIIGLSVSTAAASGSYILVTVTGTAVRTI